jgi:homoserine O-acetyltransferase
MGLFDLGRGRGGVEQALSKIYQPLMVVAIDSDRLFPLPMQQRLASAAPGASGLALINSPHGHDGFLVETDQLARIVESALQGSSPISA